MVVVCTPILVFSLSLGQAEQLLGLKAGIKTDKQYNEKKCFM